jgi:hypothetical protein
MSRFNAVCPGCRGRFPWDPKLGYPRCCPLPGCGYETEDKGEVVIAAPFIRSANTGKTDACYRQLERDSEVRAQMAADMAGVPVSEMSHLKVTNIRDTKEGEIAAIPVVNDITRQMDQIRQRGGQTGFVQADKAFVEAAASGTVTVNGQVTRGIEPRAGIRAMENIQARFGR